MCCVRASTDIDDAQNEKDMCAVVYLVNIVHDDAATGTDSFNQSGHLASPPSQSALVQQAKPNPPSLFLSFFF